MKKKCLAMLLALCMVLTLLPTAALATDAPDAGTGTASDPFADYFNAAKTEIILTADVSLTSCYTVPSTVTKIDLAGHSITGTTADTGIKSASNDAIYALLCVNGSSLEITDSSSNTTTSNGITATGSGYAILVRGTVQVTLTGVAVTGPDGGIRVQDTANLIVDGGSIKATATANDSGDCIRAYGESVVTIKGGAALTSAVGSSGGGSAVELYQSSEVNVESATITGFRGIFVFGGTLDVDNVTITVTDVGIGAGGLVPDTTPSLCNERSITVSGGSITSNNDDAIAIYASAGNAGGATDVDLTGGTYSGKINNGVSNSSTYGADLTITGGTYTNLGSDTNGQSNTISEYIPDGAEFDDQTNTVKRSGTTSGAIEMTEDTSEDGLGLMYEIKGAVKDYHYTIQMSDSTGKTIYLTTISGVTEFTVSVTAGGTVTIWETANALEFDDGAVLNTPLNMLTP